MTGHIMQKGISIIYLPKKYERVEYNLEFSSLINTSLSTVNDKTY